MWSGFPRTAKSPACITGWRVLTRPSRHSGKPVSSETLTTGIPASSIFFAVPPVDTISIPISDNCFAKASMPVLSETLMSALFILLCLHVLKSFLKFERFSNNFNPSSVYPEPVVAKQLDCLRKQTMLYLKNLLLYSLGSVFVRNFHRFLKYNRSSVRNFIYKMNSRSCHLDPIIVNSLVDLHAVKAHTAKTRNKGRMGVDYSVFIRLYEIIVKNAQVSCKNYQINFMC